MKQSVCLRLFCAIVLFAGVAFCVATAQPSGPVGNASATMLPGLVVVAKVDGEVQVIVGGVATALRAGDQVAQGATVITGLSARAILVFSTGSTVALGADSRLVLTQFLQGPFASAVAVAAAEQEPSASLTELELVRGEMIGNVVRLRADQGSSFQVRTPVGAVGIRGTVFRLVFRPAAFGQATFMLSTAAGAVQFASLPAVNGAGSLSAIMVPAGQEIVLNVQVMPTATGGTVSVVPTSPATMPISSVVMQQIMAAVADMVGAVGRATGSTPAPPSSRPAPSARGGGSSSSTTSGPSGPPLSIAPPKGPVTLEEARRYFETWGGHAVWENNLTEFALKYLSGSGVRQQYFEVRRAAGSFDIREIAALTRPLIDHGEQAMGPVVFTETAEMRADYYRRNPAAIPGRLTVPPGGPRPLPRRAPDLTETRASAVSSPGSVPGEAKKIKFSGTLSNGATFSGEAVVAEPAMPAVPPPTPPRLDPPSQPPPRVTQP